LDAARVLSAINNISTTVNSEGQVLLVSCRFPLVQNLAIGTGDGPLRSISRWDWHRDVGSSDTPETSGLTWTHKIAPPADATAVRLSFVTMRPAASAA